jgi:hypothetical protein
VGRQQATRANRAAVAEQRVRCYQLRLSGLSVRQIATATGLSVGTVSNRIQAEIDSRVLPLADEVRKVELDRLDGWLARLNAQIVAGVAVARNVEVAVRVSERRAKLLGIDAPQQLEATVHEVTQTDVALAELVREAQAAAAVAEAQLRDQQ